MKKTIIICSIVSASLLLAVAGTVYAFNNSAMDETVAQIATKDVIDSFGVASSEEVVFCDDEGKKLPSFGPMYYNQLFEYGCKNATSEQKIKLIGYDFESLESSQMAWYPRRFMTAFGYLTEDTPHLTETRAREIVAEVQGENGGKLDKEALIEIALKFNEVAGAPDFCGGSGVFRAKYTLEKGNGGADEVWIEETSLSFVTNGENFTRERIR